ncbi:MAG: MOSC domain-containing protein [Ktedonobacteraceae bacterium]
MDVESQMRVVSVNVGQPREVVWKGRTVSTGIFKAPVTGKVTVRRLNLDGDRQADLSVHGGPEKAIYVYPAEYYQSWRAELPDMDLPWAMFGENLTIEGLQDNTVNIGDEFRIGTARVVVTQPRMPCYKLGLKFKRDDILKRFLVSDRSGFYLAVLEEGEVEAGDAITLLKRDEHNLTVTDIVHLYTHDKNNLEALQRAMLVPALPEGWRNYFSERVDRLLDESLTK